MVDIGLSAIWHDEGRRWDVRYLPLPEVEPDGISVRVTATSICGADLHVWRGDSLPEGSPPRRPFAFGHEMMGVVAALGRDVQTDSVRKPLKEGDRVAFAYVFPCMQCAECLSGSFNECTSWTSTRTPEGRGRYTGGFSQYYHLSGLKFVFKLPDEIDDKVAVSCNCALVQIMEAFHVGIIRYGDDVVIQGAGGMGLYATAYADYMGANKLIVIDSQTRRLDLARRLGATDTIDMREYPTVEGRVERVMQLTGGLGADIAVDLVGSAEVVEEGAQMCKVRGKYLEVGHISSNPPLTPKAQELMGERVRYRSVQHYDPWSVQRAINFIMRTRHKYPFGDIVSHTFPLEQIDWAFRTAEWKGEMVGARSPARW